jgi:hypothetical protein
MFILAMLSQLVLAALYAPVIFSRESVYLGPIFDIDLNRHPMDEILLQLSIEEGYSYGHPDGYATPAGVWLYLRTDKLLNLNCYYVTPKNHLFLSVFWNGNAKYPWSISLSDVYVHRTYFEYES